MAKRAKSTKRVKRPQGQARKTKVWQNQRVKSILVILGAAILGWIFGSTFLTR